MYNILLPLHNWVRWLALLFLVITIARALSGYFQNREFSKTDNLFRHWSATMMHIQLIVGMLLYVKSSLIPMFWKNMGEYIHNLQLSFFNIIHPILVLVAIAIITIGSALAKRRTSDKTKFKTILVWYLIGLLILFLAIPWSFSPFVSRPNFRPF